MSHVFPDARSVMQRAIELAARGLGSVEPNPPVGAVIVDENLRLLGEGFHEKFGGPHAEVHAIGQAGPRAAGATLYVTLEPCCHQGKTGPCTKAVVDAGLRRVVVAMQDPAPHVSGGGIAALKAAGVEVEVGLLEREARRLTAPFVKLVTTGLPWVHAKWAMTLDGRIATRTGASRWISGEASREIVHRLRGRMDAIVIGSGTAAADDPLLTARPPGPRTATRIVVDSQARLSTESQLVRTVDQAPVLVATLESAPEADVRRLRQAGVEVVALPPAETEHPVRGSQPELEDRPDLAALVRELGRRQMTNVLVEGGGRLLGGFFDRGLIDEAHVFVAPKIVGGEDAVSPVLGAGLDQVLRQPQLDEPQVEIIGGDVYIHGPLHESGRAVCDPPRPVTE